MVQETLLAGIPTPQENIHRIAGELAPDDAAAKYETELKTFFGGEPPVFDLVLLGLGENAHTASLFPHTPELYEEEHLVTDVHIPRTSMYRITMTASLINQAHEIVFLVSGAQKAGALQHVLEGSYQPHEYPAQLIRPESTRPIWLIDRPAAHKLVGERVEAA